MPRSSVRYETGKFPRTLLIGGERFKVTVTADGVKIGCTFIGGEVIASLNDEINAAAAAEESED